VALYRSHGDNASADRVAMLDGALAVLDRNRPDSADPAGVAAARMGRKHWRLLYANAVWSSGGRGAWSRRWSMTKRAPAASLLAASWRGMRRLLPVPVRNRLKRLAGRTGPPVGTVDMGDFARSQPVSRHFGYDRGTPVDRWYVERFLADHAGDIRGRVLEVGDASYSRRFGKDIDRQDILHVSPGNAEATIVGDLSQPGLLPEAAFDCVILTQTLHLIYDLAAAVAELRRSLAPGGVLLLTVPGVASVDRGEWGDRWQWSLTRHSATRLFEQEFGPSNVAVTAEGNVYAATCFLQGLAVEEIEERLLGHDDPAYPLVVCVRATRAAA
jgi:SAM-dependent methyltransferase